MAQILRGRPEDVLPAAWRAWQIDRVAWEYDSEPYARRRDETMAGLAVKSGLAVHTPLGYPGPSHPRFH